MSTTRLLGDLRQGIYDVTAPYRDIPPIETLGAFSCANYVDLLRSTPLAPGIADESSRWWTDAAARDLLRSYFVSAYSHIRRTNVKVWHGLRLEAVGILPAGVGGVANDELVDIAMLNLQCGFNMTPRLPQIPEEVFYIALAKAWLFGCDSAFLVVMDANSNAWSGFKVRGNGEFVIAFLEEQFGDALDYSVTAGAKGVKPAPARGAQCAACIFRSNGCSSYLGGGRVEWDSCTPEFSVEASSARLNNLDAMLRLKNVNYARDSSRKQRIFSPSEFSIADCDRQLAYGRLGAKRIPRFKPSTLRIFDFGHIYHDLLQSSFEAAFGRGFVRETPRAFSDFPVEGTCDGEVGDIDVELKSIGASGFESISAPKPEHFVQANTYAIARPGAPPNLIAFVYMNKATCAVKVFERPPDKQVWRMEKSRLMAIENKLRAGKLPDPYKNRSVKTVCEECPFHHICIDNAPDPVVAEFEAKHGRS